MNKDPINTSPLNTTESEQFHQPTTIWSIIMNLIKRFFAWLVSLFTRNIPKAGSQPSNEGGGKPVIYPDPVDPPRPEPNTGDTLGPDDQGRIRIPEVEALGGDWAGCWWYAPWTLESHGSTLTETAAWQLRFACGCDENGELGPAPNRGYDGKQGMTPYSWLVPRKFVRGIDRYGRKITFMASTTDYMQDGVIHQARQLGEPIRITDKLTRATRAANGQELADYLKANPNIVPVPTSGPDWPIGGDRFSG